MKELPWEKIKEMNEQKKSELTFEKEPEVIPDEKPFWEVDDHAGSPEVKPEVKKLDDMSWEEPENIIHDTNQGPPPLYNTTALAKLVHLDFKGAPLKMYFIEKFIQNITTWGGTGLLMEYEDTFPFSGRFSVLKGKFTYTEDFIKKLNSQAKQNNLEVIPYISLFDDLGFLLKHPEFKKYRDNSKYTELINPLHDDSGLCSLIKNKLGLFHWKVSSNFADFTLEFTNEHSKSQLTYRCSWRYFTTTSRSENDTYRM